MRVSLSDPIVGELIRAHTLYASIGGTVCASVHWHPATNGGINTLVVYYDSKNAEAGYFHTFGAACSHVADRAAP